MRAHDHIIVVSVPVAIILIITVRLHLFRPDAAISPVDLAGLFVIRLRLLADRFQHLRLLTLSTRGCERLRQRILLLFLQRLLHLLLDTTLRASAKVHLANYLSFHLEVLAFSVLETTIFALKWCISSLGSFLLALDESRALNQTYVTVLLDCKYVVAVVDAIVIHGLLSLILILEIFSKVSRLDPSRSAKILLPQATQDDSH